MSKISGGWYVALVRPNSVEIALRNLLRQGFEVFYPREFETRRKGTKFVDVVRPVFPGYLFVSLAVDGSDVRKVNSTYGVARLVSFGGAPARVPNWAPITAPNSNSPASIKSTVWVCTDCSNVTLAVTKMIWNRDVPTTTEVGMPSR